MARGQITLCSFCGKSHAEVRKLVSGPGVFICDGCGETFKQVLDKELAAAETKAAPRFQIKQPAEIKAELFKLPLNVNSMRARKHQEALHKALDDVENSIKIFERPVVYIQA